MTDLLEAAHDSCPCNGSTLRPHNHDDPEHKDCPLCRDHHGDIDAADEAAESRACHHGWRGTAPERGQKIATPCPACGLQSLFIGAGGHLTCASVPKNRFHGCPSPSVAETVTSMKRELAAARRELADAMERK